MIETMKPDIEPKSTGMATPAITRQVLSEKEIEAKWDDLFAHSQDLLEKWADRALAEHRTGKTIPLG
jgi:hypothetical protein